MTSNCINSDKQLYSTGNSYSYIPYGQSDCAVNVPNGQQIATLDDKNGPMTPCPVPTNLANGELTAAQKSSVLLGTNPDSQMLSAPLSQMLDGSIPTNHELPMNMTPVKHVNAKGLIDKVPNILKEVPFGPKFLPRFANGVDCNKKMIESTESETVEEEMPVEAESDQPLMSLVQSVRDTIEVVTDVVKSMLSVEQEEEAEQEAEDIVSGVAEEVEEAFTNDKEESLPQTTKEVNKVLVMALKRRSKLPDEVVIEMAEAMTKLCLHKLLRRKGIAQMYANSVVNSKPMKQNICDVTGVVSDILTSTSRLEIDPNYGAKIRASNMAAVEEATNKILQEKILPYAATHVDGMKRGGALDNGAGYYSCVDLEQPNEVLKEIAEEVANEVHDGVVENFIAKLPETFTSKAKKTKYSGNDGMIRVLNGDRKVNLRDIIKQITHENFADLSYEMGIGNSESMPEVEGVVRTVIKGAAPVTFESILAMTTDSALTEEGKVVSVNAVVNCPFNKKEVLASSLSSVISGKLATDNVKKVEVVSSGAEESAEQTEVTVKAVLPEEASEEEVSEKITEAFNETVNTIVGNTSSFFDLSKPCTARNVVLVMFVIIVLYFLFKRK